MTARVDTLSGAVVHVVSDRQDRPNRPPDAACPFCPGGLEAPEPYETRCFPNRWPPLPDGRAEVVLYTPEHDTTLWRLGPTGVRRVVDLWAERTAALGSRDDVGYVLVFENRGAEVGATISHPHGQIYAFADVPPVPHQEADRARASGADPLAGPPTSSAVGEAGGWCSWVPTAPTLPVELVLAPAAPVPDLVALDDAGRDDLARLLVDSLRRLDRLYDEPLPYLLWVHQAPAGSSGWPVRLHVHVASTWRAAGVPRFVAAGELGSGVYFNPVEPGELATRLRALDPADEED